MNIHMGVQGNKKLCKIILEDSFINAKHAVILKVQIGEIWQWSLKFINNGINQQAIYCSFLQYSRFLVVWIVNTHLRFINVLQLKENQKWLTKVKCFS